MLQKTMCALTSMVLSCSVFMTSAAAACTADMSVSIADNGSVILSSDITTDEEGAMLIAVLYLDGKLQKVCPFSISGSGKITKNIVTAPSSSDFDKPFTDITPDKVETYIWSFGNLRPLTKKEDLLTPERLEKANEKVVSMLLQAVKDIKNIDGWEPEERKILKYIYDCVDDAVKLKDEKLLTNEFILRHYDSQIRSAKAIYDSMDSNKQKTFYNRFNQPEDIDAIAYLMEYFRLKQWIM